MIRNIEITALQKATTVDAALNAVVQDSPLLLAARTSGLVGTIGGTLIGDPPIFPPIDPITGLPIEDPASNAGPFLAGDVCGGKGVA